MEDILNIVLTSSVISTIIGIVVSAYVNFLFESKKSTIKTRFDSLKLAVDLEGYVLFCADQLSDHATAIDSHGHSGKLLTSIPKLPELPIDVGLLRLKKPKLANKILILNQEHEVARQNANFGWDVVGDRDCEVNARVKETADFAKMVLQLSIDIRNELNLPIRNLNFGTWNISDFLNKYGT